MGTKYADITYGDAGDRIPVRTGDVWAVGEHIFMCGDAETNALGDFGRLLPNAPELVYVDPPWGPGNATGFRRKAAYEGKANYFQLLRSLAEFCQSCTGSVFVEMGLRWQSHLTAAMAQAGGSRRNVWETTYYRRSPATLHRYTFTQDPGWGLDLSGMDDEVLPAYVLGALTGEMLVVDPMMGQGLVAVEAIRAGHLFYGFELHPRRTAVAIDRCAQLTGEKPRQL